jgi:transaldolase
MKFFVDTADTAEIKSPPTSGLSGGVTNPWFVTKSGKKFTDIFSEIRASVPGPDWSRTGRTIA